MGPLRAADDHGPARLSAALLPTPALPPPFTLKELELPLIDAQTCDGYYHENSGISSEIPIILDDMLCAGFESGQKDACGVSGHPWWAQQALPPPQHPRGPPQGRAGLSIPESIQIEKHVLGPCLPLHMSIVTISSEREILQVLKQTVTVSLSLELFFGGQECLFFFPKKNLRASG